jgi:transitional endoplasmic reticulum ATPase
MDEFAIVRSLALRAAREVTGKSALGKALMQWAAPNRRWLMGDEKQPMGWRALKAALARDRAPEPLPHPIRQADALARALRLEEKDGMLLRLCVAGDRCPRVTQLLKVLADGGIDVPTLLAEEAGMDAHALRRTAVFRLGLVRLHANRAGRLEIDMSWTMDRLLDRAADTEEALIEAVVGQRQSSRLDPADFIGQEAKVGLLVRLLKGALAEGAAGINILIHGPPGTGKTELARTLAKSADAALFSVGEADEDGEEPNRWDRVTSLQLAHRALAGRRDAVLLFDEMEDMIGDARPAGNGDWFAGRQGSKIFINRLLESNSAPVIWTTNAVGNIDSAILRRMSFVLELGLPSRRAGQRMLERIAVDEGVVIDDAVCGLVAAAPEAATVLRVAARAGRLAGEGADVAEVAGSLSRALRGGAVVTREPYAADLDLYEADRDMAKLFAGITAPGAPRDFSLLLTGPPGTGKTALAHRLAVSLDRPLIQKRASDLLSKWVGETEQKIAEAFEEAEREDGVLLFDEVDSLLFDRTDAKQSWQVSQVNELLTWLERHPLPFVAATNYAGRLDPAALRRFVFKLELLPFGRERAARAFERFFGVKAPVTLGEVANLTPGDFAVVKRQLRFAGEVSPGAIVERLRAEADAKPESGGRLGF